MTKGMKVLDKISLICKSEDDQQDLQNLGPYFEKWVIAKLPDDYVLLINQVRPLPYAIKVLNIGNRTYFTLISFTDDFSDKVKKYLLTPSIGYIQLSTPIRKIFRVLGRQIQYLTEKNLSDILYQTNQLFSSFSLHFCTATAFKESNNYVFPPNLRLIFQSLIDSFNIWFTDWNVIPPQLLEEICQFTSITYSHINFTLQQMDNFIIPTFTGSLRINCQGSDYVRNFITMLLYFGEYSGIGIKTNSGMGALSLEF